MRSFFSINQKISKYSAFGLLAAALAVLAGCGGGSPAAPKTATDTTTPPVATASSVQLLVSNSQMPSSGVTLIDVTAVVLGASRQVVATRTVAFSTGSDTTAFINNISASGVSDANGIVTAKLNLGSNKTNRTITLTATVDGVTGTNTVDVTGTAITISGSSSLSFGASTTLTFSVKDAAGTAMPNVPVTLASQTGNTISPASGTTNGAGQITASVTATKSGNDVITAAAAGTTKAQALTISSASLVFSAPTLLQIPLNAAPPTAVSVRWTNNGIPVVNQPVSFSATRGTIAGSPAVTDATGTTTGVTISAASAGPAIISAAGPGGTPAATLNVVFVATSASTVTPQASPGTVQPTTTSASQTNNTSSISAIVRDAVGNLVQSARVNFTITADPSGGSLSAPSAVTDGSGTASVTYTAGGTSSPQNGVVISATVVDINGATVTPVGPSSVALTVGGAALFVRLGTDNTVGTSATNSAAYTKTYSALVTDSAGNPVPANTEVRFALRPSGYAKGQYIISGTVWAKDPAVGFTCPNEDLDFNGILNPGEDTNGNLRLDPGNVASVNGSATTNANGFAIATLNYAKEYATWASVVLEARAGVVGNDPPALATFFLPGAAADYNNKDVPPPGRRSPFGLGDPSTNDANCNSAF